MNWSRPKGHAKRGRFEGQEYLDTTSGETEYLRSAAMFMLCNRKKETVLIFQFSFIFSINFCHNHQIYTLYFLGNLTGSKSLEAGSVMFYRSSGNCSVD